MKRAALPLTQDQKRREAAELATTARPPRALGQTGGAKKQKPAMGESKRLEKEGDERNKRKERRKRDRNGGSLCTWTLVARHRSRRCVSARPSTNFSCAASKEAWPHSLRPVESSPLHVVSSFPQSFAGVDCSNRLPRQNLGALGAARERVAVACYPEQRLRLGWAGSRGKTRPNDFATVNFTMRARNRSPRSLRQHCAGHENRWLVHKGFQRPSLAGSGLVAGDRPPLQQQMRQVLSMTWLPVDLSAVRCNCLPKCAERHAVQMDSGADCLVAARRLPQQPRLYSSSCGCAPIAVGFLIDLSPPPLLSLHVALDALSHPQPGLFLVTHDAVDDIHTSYSGAGEKGPSNGPSDVDCHQMRRLRLRSGKQTNKGYWRGKKNEASRSSLLARREDRHFFPTSQPPPLGLAPPASLRKDYRRQVAMGNREEADSVPGFSTCPVTASRLPRLDEAASEVNILAEKHVCLYCGDTATSLSKGTLYVTSLRLVWIEQDAPLRSLCLSLDRVDSVKARRGFLMSSPKVTLHLKPEVPTADSTGGDQASASAASSSADGSETVFVQLSLRSRASNTTSDDVAKAIQQALSRLRDARAKQAQAPVRNFSTRQAGVGGIMTMLESRNVHASATVQSAFADLSTLSKNLDDLVKLSESISRVGEFREFVSDLIVSPITREQSGSEALYHRLLSRQIADFLRPKLSDANPLIGMLDAYILYNAARKMDMVSPQDFAEACAAFGEQHLPFQLMSVGDVKVISTSSFNVHEVGQRVMQFLTAGSRPCVSDVDLAREWRMPVAIARDYLLACEKNLVLCRDETLTGLFFYPNKFMEFIS